MKIILKILNIVFSVASILFTTLSLAFRLFLFFAEVEFLVPIALVACYVALCVSSLSIALNFLVFIIAKGNKFIPISILAEVVSLIVFIVSLCL